MESRMILITIFAAAVAMFFCYIITLILGEGEELKLREMGYSDYGLTQTDADTVIKRCRSEDPELHKQILQCAYDTNPMIGADLYYSICQDVSYERLDAIKNIPYSKGDFYGYRRKCIATIQKTIFEEE